MRLVILEDFSSKIDAILPSNASQLPFDVLLCQGWGETGGGQCRETVSEHPLVLHSYH